MEDIVARSLESASPCSSIYAITKNGTAWRHFYWGWGDSGRCKCSQLADDMEPGNCHMICTTDGDSSRYGIDCFCKGFEYVGRRCERKSCAYTRYSYCHDEQRWDEDNSFFQGCRSWMNQVAGFDWQYCSCVDRLLRFDGRCRCERDTQSPCRRLDRTISTAKELTTLASVPTTEHSFS